MKKFRLALLIAILTTSFAACRKSATVHSPSGAIKVVNVLGDGATLALNNFSQPIYNNSSVVFELQAGQDSIRLSSVPVPDATGGSPAPVTYFNGSVRVDDGSNMSLFLAGSYPQVDTVLVHETYGSYTDSVTGIRFIHLATGAGPVSVDIAGNANGSEIPSLAYLAYSPFRQYPAGLLVSPYTFEFRDAATGTLLTTYTVPPVVFQNLTLALTGPAGYQQVVQINNYPGGSTVN